MKSEKNRFFRMKNTILLLRVVLVGPHQQQQRVEVWNEKKLIFSSISILDRIDSSKKQQTKIKQRMKQQHKSTELRERKATARKCDHFSRP